MAETAFIILNVPNEEEDVINYLETILDTDVKFEYSLTSKSALITLDCDRDLKEIAKAVKDSDQSLLDNRTGDLSVVYPGHRDDAVFVPDLKVDYLSHQFLRLYIESTFADGYSVIDECKPTSLGDNNAIVTFKGEGLEVRSCVLEKQDHSPLHSVEDFHIQFKPFYEVFYSKDNTAFTPVPIPDSDPTPSPMFTPPPSHPHTPPPSLNPPTPLPIPDEEDKVSMNKLRWKLLETKIKTITGFEMNYDSNKETLSLRGKNVASCKSDILTLQSNVRKSSFELNEKMSTLLKNGKMKSIMDQFCANDLKRETVYDITETALNVCSFGNDDENAKKLWKRISTRTTVQLPDKMPKEKRHHFSTFCKHNYLVNVSLDNDQTMFTLEGPTEDVEMASVYLKEQLEDFIWVDESYVLLGKQALFVKKFAMKDLEDMFGDKGEMTNDGIVFKLSRRKGEKRELDEKFKSFKGNIREVDVDLKDFNDLERALIYNNFKTRHKSIDSFENSNTCCLFVEGIENKEFLGTKFKQKTDTKHSATPQLKTSQRSVRQQNVFSIGSAFKLQICKNTNILMETTDLFVCGVHESLKLNKTSVSKDFSKADSNLQNEIMNFSFSQNGSYVDQRSIQGTSCKAVAFIILKPYEQGSSEKVLTAAVNEILNEANKMGLASISIPPLGFGRAFKFPVKVAAQIVVEAVDSFVKANPLGLKLNHINLLAPEANLFDEVVNAASNLQNVSNDETDTDRDDVYEDTDENEIEIMSLKKEPRISLVTNKKEDVVSKMKSEAKNQWLYERRFSPSENFCWPPQFMNDMVKTAKSYGVWLSKIQDASTNKFFLNIKGNKEDVFSMVDELRKKIEEYNSDGNKKILFSSQSPQRGMLDFVKYAADCAFRFPTYWKLQWSDYQKKGESGSKFERVDVDPTTFQAIEQLVVNTWELNNVGRGNDAANIPAKSQVKVIKIQRLENPSLFKKYDLKRKSICEEIYQSPKKQICPDVGQIRGSNGPAKTMVMVPKLMEKELLNEINEYYLFHGTKKDIVSSICNQGMDNRLSNSGAMFGKGVYLAESSTKADQYADDRDSREPNGTNLTMFLSRVVLGDVFLCDHNHESVQDKTSKKLRRPPCCLCLKDACNCTDAYFFNSVMGDGKWIFREFVVYDKEQCYPEYVIDYIRCVS